MPLIQLWHSNANVVDQFSIEQVVATAGNGDLKDESVCSSEIRRYFSEALTQKLASYIDRCLSTAFSKSGMVLQDLINELGRRLDFDVENGRYQGTINAVGFDGIWTFPEGKSIVVEVKTTDAYRISLNRIVDYKDRLVQSGRINQNSAILIVVGREDTGELEAQVRGSRHAWDIRLLSTESLLKLVQLKENAGDLITGKKIRELLFPMEYTRLDQIIDVMFTAATDVSPSISIAEAVVEQHSQIEAYSVEVKETQEQELAKQKSSWEFTDSRLLQGKRDAVLQAVGKRIGASLIKKSRALYWDASHEKRVACSISKRYKSDSYRYWYAFHPQWEQFLQEGKSGYFVLGCMEEGTAFCIPWNTIRPLLPNLNTTTTERSTYWHIHIGEDEISGYYLLLSKADNHFSLKEFEILIDDVVPLSA